MIVAWVAAAACLVSFGFGGLRGLGGMGAGIAATSVSVFGWWPVIGLLGQAAASSRGTDERPHARRLGAATVVTVFLFKLPVFAVLALFARWLGGAAIPSFLAGMGLVYSALIGWGRSYDARSG